MEPTVLFETNENRHNLVMLHALRLMLISYVTNHDDEILCFCSCIEPLLTHKTYSEFTFDLAPSKEPHLLINGQLGEVSSSWTSDL